MDRLIVMLAIVLMAPQVSAQASLWDRWSNLWRTPEQQGQRLFERGDFAAAAKFYRDPMHIGSALYRAGEFEAAAAAFGRVGSAEGAFNQGTALILQGKYEAAITAFDRALAAQPEWPAAMQNRAIAEARLNRLQNHEAQEATEVGADDVVFDSDKANKSEQTDQVTESGQGPSDQELRALWLNRSQTSPAVFLKAKFAAQLSVANSQVSR